MTSIIPLVFYVDQAWRRSGGIHTPLLNSWWGNPLSNASLFTKQLFDTYSFNTECYSVTDDLEKADLVLAPYPQVWFFRHDTELLDECVRVAQETGLPLLLDGTADIEYPIKSENVYVLRYGGYRFIPEERRIQIPLFADDLLERCRGGQQSLREKGSGVPTVGFAGWTKLTLTQYLRTVIKEIPLRLRSIFDARYRACIKGVLWRQKTIKLLERSRVVAFHSRARSSFSGTSKTAEGDMQELREQMVETILESDYALDVKGDANNSARLFEILSLGRIPVIIDTERNLPFSDRVNYSSFALVVDFRNIERLPELIAEFHRQLSPERFKEMQKNAREAYLRHFRIDALMQSIVSELRKQGVSGRRRSIYKNTTV